MKYISLTSLVAAYNRNAATTANKFWGILGILYAIRESILPGKSYSFNPDRTAQFLENLFCLGTKKDYAGSRNNYFAMFSKVWVEKLREQMCNEAPNFFDVTAWFFRHEAFPSNPTLTDLMKMFALQTGLTNQQMKTLFSFEPREIQYTDSPYQEEKLLQQLSLSGKNPLKYDSVTADGKFIKANPGEFSRAPFIQTLYASQQSTECLFLTQFPIFDYYFTENSPEEIIKANKTSETEVLVEDATLNQFVRKCFKFIYDLDKFDAFWPSSITATGWNDATFRTIKDKENGIVFTGLFRADKNDDGQYFPEQYGKDGHVWYLPSNWSKIEYAPGSQGRNALSIQCFARFVEHFYPGYSVEISTKGYKLLHAVSSSASFQSNNIIEFWNKVGSIVLDTDVNFSKLPRYYHKGHIRVKTNYGGACNFSIGFYDKNSGRVNKDIYFAYNERTDSDGEHIFYLDIDIKDPKAFERFIPVFNDVYQGIFEIAQDGKNFIFTDLREKNIEPYRSSKSRQVIYFGAPGTGKSHAVNKIVKAEAPKRNVRTTFHPDTDYSSFVGCFKPTMRDGQIEYSFTPQAFVNAYIGAWSDISKPFYLVIEEINRGNCAQIFGDIFQLLDRDQSGESSYGIRPDSDLQTYICEKLSLHPNIPEDIRSGEIMRLPSNLFILATMNTSDQSLFPIDSAFKRRWDWRYTAIKPGEKDHTLVVGGIHYNWTSFIREVNKKIYDLTKSEDKQLGYWFIKPNDFGEIDWELFVSKAIFYIWNDIVKDYATMEKEDSPFGKRFAFTTFFDEDGNLQIDQVIAFLDTLKVEKLPIPSDPDADDSTIEPDDEDVDPDDNVTSKDYTKYQINGRIKESR